NHEILPGPDAPALTVSELLLADGRYAEGYDRKDGKPTAQLARIKSRLVEHQEAWDSQGGQNRTHAAAPFDGSFASLRATPPDHFAPRRSTRNLGPSRIPR